MEDVKNSDRISLLLEGIYKGFTAKLEEVRQSIIKELQFSSAQQTYAYEALSDDLKKGVDRTVAEVGYLAQQNSAIYDSAAQERSSMSDSLLKELKEHEERLIAAMETRISGLESAVAALGEQLAQEAETEAVPEAETAEAPAQTPAEVPVSPAEAPAETPAEEEVPAEEKELLDYDLLAEKVAAHLVPVVEDSAEAKAEAAAIDYDLIAEKIAAILHPAEEPAEVSEENAAESAPRAEEHAEENSEEPAEEKRDLFDYADLAAKIALLLPNTDYDLIAEKVVAALPQNVAPAAEENAEEAVVAEEGETPADGTAEPISEHIETVSLTDETIEKIAARVAELLRADAVDLDRIVGEATAEPVVADETVELAAAEAPAPAPAPVQAPVVVNIPAPVVVTVPAAAPAVPVLDDETKMIRYKRSFVAKIIGSEEEIKEYYSELKNAILSYGKVRSQINWTNDRFFIGNDSLVKIGMRGRTLCLYLALNPDEFPESVYHQKFAGDTKMYELTPMMIKIKSKVAVKRGIRLIDLLMERNNAVKEERENVDYAAQYFYRSDEELLAEGLIKTAIVDKSDLDF